MPFKVDQLEINPSLLGQRLIDSASDGSMLFKDVQNPLGLSLSQLAGLQLVGHLLVVGSGAGSQYETIQEALDVIPIDSSATNPYYVFVGPGVYYETLNIVRDGVYICGYGATLQAAVITPDAPGAYHTVVIQAALGTVPRNVSISNFTIVNPHTNYACVRMVGAAGSEVGLGGIYFNNCFFASTHNGRPLWASTINNLYVNDCSMLGSTGAAMVYAEQCAKVQITNVSDIPNIELDFSSSLPTPAVVTNAYSLSNCLKLGRGSLAPQVTSNLTGGSLSIIGCTGGFDLMLTGDTSVSVYDSQIGNLTLTGAFTTSLIGCTRGTVAASSGAMLAEPMSQGVVSFTNQTYVAVTFAVPQPNTNYGVSVEVDGTTGGGGCFITHKTSAGFRINFDLPQTVDAVWTTNRVI
jgi:hypothetical protein